VTIGVKFPFTISGGSVVTTSNPTEIIGSNVTFLLGTLTGERLMRPNWGVDLLGTVYALGADIEEALDEAIRDAFGVHFKEYEPREINVRADPDNPAWVSVSVRFGRYDSDVDVNVEAGTPVPGGAEIYPEEGL
jgi:phage baseplate assembly protein W